MNILEALIEVQAGKKVFFECEEREKHYLRIIECKFEDESWKEVRIDGHSLGIKDLKRYYEVE